MTTQYTHRATVRYEPLLKQYYVDRRPYLHWSHNTIAKYIMNTYVKTPRDLQACYTELAHAFHLGFLMEKDKEENSGKDPALRKDDWCDILREIDELWFHLLRSGDRKKLKDRIVCNFDFLQCAVSGASVSYVRSLLELVKCHLVGRVQIWNQPHESMSPICQQETVVGAQPEILDWEVELLSAVTKQAVDVLSQDPSQLATELLNWLKPFIDISDSTSVRNLVNSALKFCNKSVHPRLVPTNSWLTLSLPPQVASMTVPHTITHSVTTPDSQHVMCASNQKEINMFHLPSKNHVRTFQGHKAPITCLHVTSSGHWLISGSEDTDVIVWNIDSGQIKHRMSNHITAVMCVTTTHSESRVLSGSEIGVVIVATLDTGQIIQRLDNHRGLISCISVHWDDDVFVTDGDRFNSCQVIYSQFGLAIHKNDHQARRRFVEWAQNEIAVVPDFHKRILFSDEAHFWLNGYINKQKCRIWSKANPQVYVETPLHPEKLTVWCALWAGGIIGLYFFKNDEGHNVTVNGDRYRAMITNFFISELNNHDVQELWFQQDGATCHTARATIDLLKDTFGDRLISCFGPVNWPPRSCDLTPLDYFLWGYVKSLVYADKPQTLDHLEDNVHRVISDIRPQMLEKVIGNWTSRLDYIRASRGSHMPEIIFKM
ncbi:NACHT domain-and WD repeat-containing protein 1 [Trichonephila clavipes]|nr:NACHT domain-and WD repeat-containing protein 1 [Trichonephila clavipes]